MPNSNNNQCFSKQLQIYIKDFFQDSDEEQAFYRGLLEIVKSDSEKTDDLIEELNEILDNIEQRPTRATGFGM